MTNKQEKKEAVPAFPPLPTLIDRVSLSPDCLVMLQLLKMKQQVIDSLVEIEKAMSIEKANRKKERSKQYR